MLEYNVYEAKTNLSEIIRKLTSKEEEMIIISKKGCPTLKVTLYENNNRDNLFGCAKGMFTIPDDFDDIDIESDFDGDIL